MKTKRFANFIRTSLNKRKELMLPAKSTGILKFDLLSEITTDTIGLVTTKSFNIVSIDAKSAHFDPVLNY